MTLTNPSGPSFDISDPELFDSGALVRELVDRGGLKAFIEHFWPYVETRPFVDGWHIGAICEYLEAVTNGEIKRLVINIPPGHMKSLTVGIFWPAWLWTLDPSMRALFGSFDLTLLAGQSEKEIAIIQGELFQSAYPYVELASKKPALREFKTTGRGFRFNTTPGGKGTGRHVDGAVVDDPMKPDDAIGMSEAAFRKVDQWFDGTLPTRVKQWIVVMMQRLHTQDLAGRCLQDGYDSLILPARQVKRSMWARDPRKEVGELLWPALFPEARVRETEIRLKNEASAQLQQDPTPGTGGFIEEAWTRLEWVEPPQRGTFCQSWDFSSKGLEISHSQVSGQLWCATREMTNVREYLSSLDDRLNRVPGADADWRIIQVPSRKQMYLLVDWVGDWWNYVQSKNQFIAAQTRPHWHKARVKLIELKANGPAIVEEMKSKFVGIKGVEPDGSKEERLRIHTEKWELGQVVYPPGRTRLAIGKSTGLGDVIREQHIKFPRFGLDDHVDTTTQALDRLCNASMAYRENLSKIAGGMPR
jgi:phage terminase large subunit-like protein